jgi:hypothetical protein
LVLLITSEPPPEPLPPLKPLWLLSLPNPKLKPKERPSLRPKDKSSLRSPLRSSLYASLTPGEIDETEVEEEDDDDCELDEKDLISQFSASKQLLQVSYLLICSSITKKGSIPNSKDEELDDVPVDVELVEEDEEELVEEDEEEELLLEDLELELTELTDEPELDDEEEDILLDELDGLQSELHDDDDTLDEVDNV